MQEIEKNSDPIQFNSIQFNSIQFHPVQFSSIQFSSSCFVSWRVGGLGVLSCSSTLYEEYEEWRKKKGETLFVHACYSQTIINHKTGMWWFLFFFPIQFIHTWSRGAGMISFDLIWFDLIDPLVPSYPILFHLLNFCCLCRLALTWLRCVVLCCVVERYLPYLPYLKVLSGAS